MIWLLKKPKKQAGVTMIEVIIIVSLIALLASAASPLFSSLVTRNSLESTNNQLISYLRKAQQYSMEGKEGSTWGVCQQGNTVVLFAGSCSSPSFTEKLSINRNISIANFNEVTFSKRGEPSIALAIEVNSNLGRKTILINKAGGMDFN